MEARYVTASQAADPQLETLLKKRLLCSEGGANAAFVLGESPVNSPEKGETLLEATMKTEILKRYAAVTQAADPKLETLLKKRFLRSEGEENAHCFIRPPRSGSMCEAPSGSDGHEQMRMQLDEHKVLLEEASKTAGEVAKTPTPMHSKQWTPMQSGQWTPGADVAAGSPHFSLETPPTTPSAGPQKTLFQSEELLLDDMETALSSNEAEDHAQYELQFDIMNHLPHEKAVSLVNLLQESQREKAQAQAESAQLQRRVSRLETNRIEPAASAVHASAAETEVATAKVPVERRGWPLHLLAFVALVIAFIAGCSHRHFLAFTGFPEGNGSAADSELLIHGPGRMKASEHMAAERARDERAAAEKSAAAAEKIEAEKAAAEKAAADKAAADEAASQKAAAEKVAADKAAAEQVATETAVAEKAAAEKAAAAETAAAETAAAEKAAAKTVAAEKAAADKAAADKAAAEKIEKAAADNAEAEQVAAEKAAADKATAEKVAVEKAAADKATAERIAAENAAADKAEAERIAAEQAAADQAAADKAVADTAAAEKAAAEKAAADEAATEQAAAEKAVAEKTAADNAAAEKAAADEAAADKAAAEKAAADKVAAAKSAVEKALAVTKVAAASIGDEAASASTAQQPSAHTTQVQGVSATLIGDTRIKLLHPALSQDTTAKSKATAEMKAALAYFPLVREAHRLARIGLQKADIQGGQSVVTATIYVANDGTVTWPSSTLLRLVFGPDMGLSILSLNSKVLPGAHVELTLQFKIPCSQAAHTLLRSGWVLEFNGEPFGPLLLLEVQTFDRGL